MTGREHDDEFEAYLKRRVPIHQRLASLERLEPSEELDRLVIGQARQAIQGPSHVRLFRTPKWALSVGLAATLVISFTVLLNIGVHREKPLEAPPIQTQVVAAPPVNATSADADSSPSAQKAAVTGATDAVAASAAKDSVVAAAAKDSVEASAARATSARAPRASSAMVANRSLAKKGIDIPVETQSTAIVDTINHHVPASPSPSVADGLAEGLAAAPPPAASALAGPPLLASTPTAPSLVEPPAAASAPVAPPLVESSSAARLAATPALAPPAGAPLQAVAATAAPAPQPAAPDARAGVKLDAATWFAQIEKLRAEGKITAAEKEFRRFRDVYPHYVPPAGSPPADGPTK